MNKHTPGPWETSWTLPWGYRRSQDGMSIIGSQPSVISPEGTVLLPHVFGRTDDEITANLTLAAAAPDLLEAAKAFDEAVDLASEAGHYTSDPRLRAAVRLAREAIAKAEGV